MHCVVCGKLCTVEVYDGPRQLREWVCQPYIPGLHLENHYSAIEKTGEILSQVVEVFPYKAIVRGNETIIFKHNGYYKAICNLGSALDLTDLNREKFLEKMKTYTVFS